MMKKIVKYTLFLCVGALILGFDLFQHRAPNPTIPFAFVIRQNLDVVVKTIGELEAAHSVTIASTIKGDQGKIIDLISDGVYVQPGQVLARLDPTPFEEKLEKLRGQIREQEAYIATLEHTLEWEMIQSEHKNRTTHLELEAAALELDKIKYGDGPQEISRLKGLMQKARLKYEELKAYSQDLIDLEAQGFLNISEVKQANKKLEEEREAYEIAQQQYDNYLQHVLPVQIKKAETHVKRAQVNVEETAKGGYFAIAKSKSLLEQAKQANSDYLFQLREAEKELSQTDIIAPTQGMVILREEYRSSQKRKPRVGDVLVKNQPLIDLPDLSSMLIKTRVREVDLFKIAVGKRAIIEIDAYPQLSFNGNVTSIGVLAMSDMEYNGEEKYFQLQIALEESDIRLRPGMTTRAIIHAQEESNVLTIPLHSIFSDGKKNYCYILHPHHGYEKRDVILGISNDQWAEVKDGVQEGECVCLLNPFK